jgi:hypothetical protein
MVFAKGVYTSSNGIGLRLVGRAILTASSKAVFGSRILSTSLGEWGNLSGVGF